MICKLTIIKNNIYILNNNSYVNIIDLTINYLKIIGTFILIPTETVYGFICLWDDILAKTNIYNAKKRINTKNFQMLIPKLSMIKDYNYDISNITQKIVDNFCPGPLTIIISNKKKKKIGFRIPNNKFIPNLLKKIKKPLAATSANISGQQQIKYSLQNVNYLNKYIKNNFNPQPNAIIIDKKNKMYNLSSTVIEITKDNKILELRKGPINIKNILNII